MGGISVAKIIACGASGECFLLFSDGAIPYLCVRIGVWASV